MAITKSVEIFSPVTNKIPRDKLHLDGGVLAKSCDVEDLVVLFISETRGVVVSPGGMHRLFESHITWQPYYLDTWWTILPKGTKIDIHLQQK